MNFDISKFNRTHLLVIGDLMIDEYLRGEVDHISPEAPVPVVAIKNQDYTLGGSGNVVNNLITLGVGYSDAAECNHMQPCFRSSRSVLIAPRSVTKESVLVPIVRTGKGA